MVIDDKDKLVPYKLLSPGWEGEYLGTKNLEDIEDHAKKQSENLIDKDSEGEYFEKISFFTFSTSERQWIPEIKAINVIQAGLGPLDDTTRRIRWAIGSLVTCDAGIPVTIDQLLNMIGQTAF